MKKVFRFLSLLIAGAVLYGCASSTPSADFKKPLTDNYRLCAEDEASVKVSAADGVTLNDFNRMRLESSLKEAINNKKKNAPCKVGAKRSFILDSKITRYDEGNAFARAMLAGLGQMHLDGDFSLLHLSETGNEPVAEFTLKKTFAWGGIYGATTRMEDIEVAFCGGVAEAIVSHAKEKAEAAR